VAGPGYNIFVLGLPGSGRTTLSQEYLVRKAASEPTPDDWCYVNNFENPRAPHILRLPAGRGVELRKDLQNLIAYCQREIPKAFESKEYIQERDRLVEELKKSQETEFLRLQEHAEKYSFLVARTPIGIILAPSAKGKPLTPEDVEKLSPEQRAKLEQLQAKLGEEVEKTLKRLREMGNAASAQIDQLNKRMTTFQIEHVVDDLRQKYSGLEQVLTHLDAVQGDILSNASRFLPREGSEQAALIGAPGGQEWSQRYEVNLLVDNSNTQGAPVIVETHPVYHNLLGRIEHEVIMGATRTDFTMIRAGAFHRANGGYLILPARDLLISPYAWEGVKRALRDGCIRIIELGNQIGLLSTETLDPQPAPLEIKVVLVGTPILYYLLRIYDEDFAKLFKVRAEFATSMDRNPETEKEYGLFVKSVVLDYHLPAFDKTAVARLIEFSSRLAEDQDKLTTRFGRISDLVREAAFWAKKRGIPKKPVRAVTAQDVQQAIEESIYRDNLLDERLQELITQDVLMVDVSGTAVGQINALSVFALGDYTFGRPSRLTVSVSPGRSGLIDIERQAKLGGPIHTKGVLILSGFLHNRYGGASPLSLSASLTFEQSYSEIEGDSASVAETIALLSAVARVPIRQDLAVTGSINQHGQVQAVGGVNEKIEGFFATCQAKGLTSQQGVLIPKANQRNLMLREDVIQAVSAGKFHIWTISTIDEGLALMTGQEPGRLQDDGTYPTDTINRAVTARLAEFAKTLERGPKEGQETPTTNKEATE
jgi:lon-related putative ATP-dependent protease